MEFMHSIAMQTEGEVLASMRTKKQVNRQDFERWVVEAFCSDKSCIGAEAAGFDHHVLRLTKKENLMSQAGQDLATQC
jgi:hypothetical protein